ncbi:MAG: DUF362 domain-containing protein [Deltaproteobacteria bacterium]|nr:DUF362 domain-containing protein [Deltaproteobacteria bacterium]
MAIRIGLSRNRGRYGNIVQALEGVKDELPAGVRIVIKPNFVSTTEPAAATHVEAVRAVIDFLGERAGTQIKIAEGAALGDTFQGFKNFGYLELKKEYPRMELVDLNRDIFETVYLKDSSGREHPFRVAQTILQSDFRISVTPPKTHDTVGVTLSLKNMLVGSLIRSSQVSALSVLWDPFHRMTESLPTRLRDLVSFERVIRLCGTRFLPSDKVKLHQGYLNINLFLFQLAGIIPPHLSVIDGYEGMEGDGPIHGRSIALDWALAGTDPLLVDRVTTRLMGFSPQDIGYLTFLSENREGPGKEKITFVGDSPQDLARPFQPHRNYERQKVWQKELAEAGDCREFLKQTAGKPVPPNGKKEDGQEDQD